MTEVVYSPWYVNYFHQSTKYRISLKTTYLQQLEKYEDQAKFPYQTPLKTAYSNRSVKYKFTYRIQN